jgi:hypothetical protein
MLGSTLTEYPNAIMPLVGILLPTITHHMFDPFHDAGRFNLGNVPAFVRLKPFDTAVPHVRPFQVQGVADDSRRSPCPVFRLAPLANGSPRYPLELRCTSLCSILGLRGMDGRSCVIPVRRSDRFPLPFLPVPLKPFCSVCGSLRPRLVLVANFPGKLKGQVFSFWRPCRHHTTSLFHGPRKPGGLEPVPFILRDSICEIQPNFVVFW